MIRLRLHQLIRFFRTVSISGQEIRPLLHQFPPPRQQIATRIRLLHRRADSMGEAQFHDGVRRVRLFTSPRSEGGSESMNRCPIR